MVNSQQTLDDVAPPTGAWIETNTNGNIAKRTKSHPLRVRGLKLTRTGDAVGHLGRTPYGCVD